MFTPFPFLSFPLWASMKRREDPMQEGRFDLTDLKKSKPAFLLSAAGLPSPLSASSVEQQLGTGRFCPGVGGGCICCPTGGRLADGPAMRPFSVPRVVLEKKIRAVNSSLQGKFVGRSLWH
jgi:hypothetical protein